MINNTDDDDSVVDGQQKPVKQRQKPSRTTISRPLLRQSSSDEDSQTKLKPASSTRALPVFRSLDDFRPENDDDRNSESSPVPATPVGPSHSFDFLWQKSSTSYIGDHFRSYDIVQIKNGGELLAKSATSAPRAAGDDSNRVSEASDNERVVAVDDANKNSVAGNQPQPDGSSAAHEKKSTEESTPTKDSSVEGIKTASAAVANATELLSTTSRVKEERIWARRMKIEQARREKLCVFSNNSHSSYIDAKLLVTTFNACFP